MKQSRFFFLTMFCSAVMLSQAAYAVIDNNATTVKLREACNEGPGTPTLNNCFTTISGANGLEDWIENKRTTSDPLVVEIGPGTFENFNCRTKNDITLKGSGPDRSILVGGLLTYGIQAWDCERFHVQDLTVKAPGFALVWNGTGSSRWTNVTIEGGSLGSWVDGLAADGCPKVTDADKPVHYWFNSRLLGTGQNYIAKCSENWFFGSEILTTGKSGAASSAFVVGNSGVDTTAKPEVHVYGSVVRVIVGTGDSYPVPTPGAVQGVIAVVANKDADVHLHGTGIDVINAGGLGNTIAALSAYGGGSIHANGAAYNLKKGNNGNVVRIIKDALPATRVHAPYMWNENTTPPDVTSVTGADTAVITSGTSDDRPHLLVYDSNCDANSSNKWYDTTDKVCR